MLMLLSISNFFLFLYFVTLHADKLSIPCFSFTLRLNNALALLLFFCLSLQHKKSLYAMDRKLLKGVLILSGSILISLLLSPYPLRSLAFVGWYGVTLVCYFFLPFIAVKHFSWETVFKIYGHSFFVVGLYALLQSMLSQLGIYDPFATQQFGEEQPLIRANALCYEPSYYALYMTPFVIVVTLRFLNKQCSFFYLLAAHTFFLASTATTAFFAYILFVLAVAISLAFPLCRTFFLSLKRVGLIFGGAIASFSLLLMILPFFKDFFLKFFRAGFTQHHSFAERLAGIYEGWKIFIEHPFFGVGLGSVPLYLLNNYLDGEESLYPVDKLVDELSFVSNPLKLFEPTNVGIEILSSLGLVGIAAFGYLFWIYFRRATIVMRKGVIGAQAYHFLIAMIVTIVVLQFNQGIFRSYIWVQGALFFAFLHQGERRTLCAQ